MDGFKGLVDVFCGDPYGIQACLAGSGTLTAELYRPGARDQRLRLYRQGRWADVAVGSGWLALQTGDVSRPQVLRQATDDEVLGIGRTWKALETWTFVQKLAIVRELIRRHAVNSGGGPATAAGGLPEEWDPRLHHEIAAALGISTVGAGKLAHLAWVLDARLPGIGEALRDNRLDPPRARLIVEETSVLEDEALFSAAERIILAGLPHCQTWSALRRLVQRAVITVDPEGAEKRRKQAERDHARVTFWRENCGTCGLQATGLPTDEALAANASIEARARQYKDAGITRPLDILRVMAFADLINGVTVAQRAAWAKADDAARQAEADKEQARMKARTKAPSGHAPDQGQPPSGGDGPEGDGPGGPDDRAPDDGDQDGPGGGGPCGSGPDAGDPRGYAPGTAGPDGGPGDDGAGRPDLPAGSLALPALDGRGEVGVDPHLGQHDVH